MSVEAAGASLDTAFPAKDHAVGEVAVVAEATLGRERTNA
jgi:hypothetical protein